jgi:hypothetical protein
MDVSGGQRPPLQKRPRRSFSWGMAGAEWGETEVNDVAHRRSILASAR